MISPYLRCMRGRTFKSEYWFNMDVESCEYIVELNNSDKVQCEHAGSTPGIVDFHVLDTYERDHAGPHVEAPSHTGVYESAPCPLTDHLRVQGSGGTMSAGMDKHISDSV